MMLLYSRSILFNGSNLTRPAFLRQHDRPSRTGPSHAGRRSEERGASRRTTNTEERAMTNAIKTPKAATFDMKLEIVVIPVSDVDRAKAFYASLGWRLDADFASGDGWRVIQFTPPGSPASVIFGKNVTAAAPGSAQGLYLIVSDIEGARSDLIGRGVEVSDVFHGAGDTH